jgi:PAS domain S-box-containing protein
MSSNPNEPLHKTNEEQHLHLLRRHLTEDADWARDLIAHSRDLLCLHDLEGRLLSVNPVPAQLLGYSVEEILDVSMRDLVDPKFRDQFDSYLRQIASDGEATGILAVLTRTGQRRLWEYHCTLRTEGVDKPVVRGIAHDITDRVAAERALSESNKKLAETATSQESLLRGLQLFRALLDHSNDAIEVIDPATLRFLDVNERSCISLGYSRSELLSMTVFDIDPHVTTERLAKTRERLDLTSYEIIESVHRRKDASIFPVEINIRLVHLDREYFVAISRDITERKLRNDRLQEYEKVVENLDEMIAVVSRDRRYVIANRSYLRYRGMTTEQVVGRNVTEIVDPDAYKTIKPKLDESFRGQVVDYEMSQSYPQIGEKDLSIKLLPIQSPEGVDRVAAVMRDVTEQNRSAARLEESEKRFRAVHDRAPVGIALIDSRTGRFLQINPKYCEIVGRTEQEMLQLTFQDITHPADGDRSISLSKELRDEKVRDYDIEKRYLKPDGRIVWVNLSVVPMWAPGEQARMHMAIVQDITERRRAEEELRQAKERLTEEKLYLEREIDTELGFENIIGKSHSLRAVMEAVGKVAASDATVLLLGETGTGKELIARAIHRLSQREGNAFIKMNCAAIPSGLLESELFGYEKGAFSGAASRKIGRLELADKGTIFLDEIGEISLALQPKLLRVLQDQEFERLGGTQTLKINFRLIAATNRDLAKSVRDKEFRTDLYYRLNVFPIFLPPLRERREDIPLLVEHFVQKIGRRLNKSILSIPKKTMDALVGWSWPGNVRELENFLERSLILSTGSVLTAPLSELQHANRDQAHEQTLEAAERRHILNALRESRGKISGPRGAATRLGLKRTTLQSKLKQLGINPHASAQSQ